jgi:hypothetical protein
MFSFIESCPNFCENKSFTNTNKKGEITKQIGYYKFIHKQMASLGVSFGTEQALDISSGLL